MNQILVATLSLTLAAPAAAWTSWEASPQNWENSPMNWDNSPMNWANSPLNFENSQLNANRRSLQDAQGNPIGYLTTTPDGVINAWSNDGRRLGYGR